MPQKRVLLVSNSSFSIYNFRLSFIRYLLENHFEVHTAAPDDEYEERLRNQKITFWHLPFSRSGLSPIEAILLVKRARDLYRAVQPALVHHFTIKPVLFGSIAARISPVPWTVNTITGLGHTFEAKKTHLLYRAVPMLYRVSAGSPRSWIVFQNAADRDLFLSQRIANKSRTELIFGSGIDTTRFSPADSSDQFREPIFLFSGRLLREKGILELLAAAGRFRALYPQVRILIAGTTDPGNPSSIESDRLQSAVDSGIVEWLGPMDPDQMPSVYRRASIFVLPSYREGLSRSLLEAASSGLAVITTDAPGCRETVVPNESGFLIPPRDSEALFKAMEFFVKNPLEVQKYGTRGRAHVIQKFGAESINQAYLNVYKRLLASA